jgi:putative oxidoreductase
MNSFLRLGFFPHANNFALLVLRLFVGSSLFLKHGLEKITGFSQMAAHFPDPLHIGAQWSLAYALFSDGLCSLLIVIGLGTRWAAFFIAVNTAVAFTFVHRLRLSGEHNGELAWMYLAAALTLFFAGAGKFSVDHGLASHGGERRFREGRQPARRKFKAAGRL